MSRVGLHAYLKMFRFGAFIGGFETPLAAIMSDPFDPSVMHLCRAIPEDASDVPLLERVQSTILSGTHGVGSFTVFLMNREGTPKKKVDVLFTTAVAVLDLDAMHDGLALEWVKLGGVVVSAPEAL